MPDKQGVDDVLVAGRSPDDIAASATTQLPPSPNEPAQSAQLVALAIESGVGELFHTPEGDACASVMVNGHAETWPIRSSGFRSFLSRTYYAKSGRVPNSQSLQDALMVMEGEARYGGPEHKVHVRLAGLDGAVYLDLANEKWECVKVTSQGWEITDNPPVKFKRPKGMLPHPTPVRGGDINALRQFVNLSDDEWPLLLGLLVGCLNPSGPYAIAALTGQHGSAKSTAGKVFRRLIDPNQAELRATPKEQRDLSIAASNSWVLGYDNLTHIQPWLSDALCRMATGGGYAVRKNYSDDEEMIFDGQRPVIMTGISDYADKPDLIDRCVFLSLLPISDENRRRESELWPAFEKDRPALLGSLLDAVVVALRDAANISSDSLPRMADFAAWASAAERAWPCDPGSFLAAYRDNRAGVNESVIENSLVARGVIELMKDRETWEGTADDLLKALTPDLDKDKRKRLGWPVSPRGVTSALNAVAPNLHGAGVAVSRPTIRTSRGRLIQLERVRTVTTVTTVIPSSKSHDGRADGDDGRGNRQTQPPQANQVQGDGGDGYDGIARPSFNGHVDADVMPELERLKRQSVSEGAESKAGSV